MAKKAPKAKEISDKTEAKATKKKVSEIIKTTPPKAAESIPEAVIPAPKKVKPIKEEKSVPEEADLVLPEVPAEEAQPSRLKENKEKKATKEEKKKEIKKQDLKEKDKKKAKAKKKEKAKKKLKAKSKTKSKVKKNKKK